MKKIIFVILHGSVYKDRYDTIVSTWGKDVDLLFYSDYEDKDKNIIKVSNRNDYHSNEEKHIHVLNFLKNNYTNYEWFFFCDDDTFVNTKKLMNCLDSFNPNSVHGSVMSCYPRDKSLKYCSGGAGYLIHRNLINKISENIKVINSGYSDVTLGYFLRENNIDVVNYDWFRSQPPSYFNYKIEEISNYITFHYIKTKEEMSKLTHIL